MDRATLPDVLNDIYPYVKRIIARADGLYGVTDKYPDGYKFFSFTIDITETDYRIFLAMR